MSDVHRRAVSKIQSKLTTKQLILTVIGITMIIIGLIIIIVALINNFPKSIVALPKRSNSSEKIPTVVTTTVMPTSDLVMISQPIFIPSPTLTFFPTPYTVSEPVVETTYRIRETSTPPPAPRVVIVDAGKSNKGITYIILLNSSSTLSMEGWSIENKLKNIYVFQGFTFHKASVVRVNMSTGQNTQTDIFIGETDIEQENLLVGSIVLKNNTGSVVDEFILNPSSSEQKPLH